MYNDEEIEDSLAFCKQIDQYYKQNGRDGTQDAMKKSQNEMASFAEIASDLPEKSVSVSSDLGEKDLLMQNGTVEKIKQNSLLRFINNLFVFAVCVLLAYFIASIVTHYVAHQTWVEGDSMEPTLSDGDSIIIQRVNYYFGDPKRYDVVVFPVKNILNEKNNDDTYYVKRVIGLPGETVHIKQGRVYINQKLLESDTYCLSDILDGGNANEPITLGKKEYFVLGDNRNMSTDSRSDYVGIVKRDDIVGEVWMRIWPFSHIGMIPK